MAIKETGSSQEIKRRNHGIIWLLGDRNQMKDVCQDVSYSRCLDLHSGGSLWTQIRSSLSASVSVSLAITICAPNLPQVFSPSVLLLMVSAALCFFSRWLDHGLICSLFQIS